MAIGIASAIGDEIYYKLDPITGATVFTGFTDILLNKTSTRYFDKYYRYSIDGIYYSTSNKKEDSYAKPKLGLFQHAEATLPGVKFKGGAYVGDSIEDLLMADRAGAMPVLVLSGNGKRTLEKLKSPAYMMLRPKVKTYETLLDFALSL